MRFDQRLTLRVHHSIDAPAHGKDLILISQLALVMGFKKIELDLASIHIAVHVHDERFDTAKAAKHTPLKDTNRFRHIITPLTD